MTDEEITMPAGEEGAEKEEGMDMPAEETADEAAA